MTRILLADDHPLLRESLRQLFALLPDIRVDGDAETEEQLLDAVQNGDFDLLLLDVSLYQASKAGLIGRVRAIRKTLPILVISLHNEPQVARQALMAGATGFITKDSEPETLLAAVRSTVAGASFLDPAIARANTVHPPVGALHASFLNLSSREREVLVLLTQGRSIASIAESLLIHRKTACAYRNRLMKKTGTESEADLVRYAIEHDLAC